MGRSVQYSEEDIRRALDAAVKAGTQVLRQAEAESRVALIKLMMATMEDFERMTPKVQAAAVAAGRAFTEAGDLRKKVADVRRRAPKRKLS